VFKENGVDDVLCVSVNDAFVMNAWMGDQSAENIRAIPDGNGEFSEKMGMLVNKEGIGFGKRSWRYSMLVNDGTIEKMFIEPEKEGDPFEVSDADTMLAYINPNAKAEEAVVVFSKVGCPHCARAKSILKEKGLPFTDVVVEKNVPTRVIRGVSGEMTVPQVFIGGKRIGGADALAAYFQK
jgi:glutaredoxin-like protein